MPRLARPVTVVVACHVLLGLAACSGEAPSTPLPSLGPSAPAVDVLVPGAPAGWGIIGSAGYQIGVDRSQHHGGGDAAYIIRTTTPAATDDGLIYQNLRADAYRGKRVRWSAWVKNSNVVSNDIGLFMRVDGPGQTLAFDDMSNRRISGTADWHQVAVVLDVAPAAIGFQIGFGMVGTGTLLVDDMALDVVGTDVASTNALTGPTAGRDSVTLVSDYSRSADAPANLDFESSFTTPQAAVDWVAQHAVSLITTDPTANRSDLGSLQQMIGDAHLVGLGEDTHGTREFFRMKHRIIETLVADMGFTTFAIEATTPEANDMNRYVLGGPGDPKVLLSRLYFWTWNTREVADMIDWMRQWNAGAAASRKVQFLGFDMQTPGASMDSIQSFVTRIRSSDSAYVALRFNCINPYRNVEPHTIVPLNPSFYAGQTAAARAACATGLQEVRTLVAADSARGDGQLPASIYSLRLHDVRLVQQFESMIALSGSASNLARDKAMAENVGWIRDQAGPGAKIVLWAHNGHINSIPQLMGGYLRAAYGSDYVSLGFLFGSGGFNAVGANGEGLKPWNATLVPPNSIEAIFVGTGKPALLLDTRQLTNAGSAAAALRGPLPMRSIGAVFSTATEASYFTSSIFPADFDLLVYLQTTTPSTLLPFVYQ